MTTPPEEPALLRNLASTGGAQAHTGGAAAGETEIDLLAVGRGGGDGAGSQSGLTVALAFGVNLVIAIGKSAATDSISAVQPP